MTTSPAIARIKVILDHVDPPVRRRFEVPLTIKLDRLHAVLQVVLGWTNSHLYAFHIRGASFGIPDPDWGNEDTSDARKAKLVDVLEDTGAKSFKYLYDFGDGWEHSVTIQGIQPAIPGVDYPQLIEASGRCPPEDVGGPWGYQEAREALTDPKHERHQEIAEWWGLNSTDLDTVDIPTIESELAKLSRRWTKKPRVKP